MLISANKENRGKPIRDAYEDIRAVPQTSFLRDIDSYEFFLPSLQSIVPVLEDVPDILENESTANENTLEASITPASNQKGAEDTHSAPNAPREDLPRQELVKILEVRKMFDQEESLLASHLSTVSLITGQKPRRMSRHDR